MCFSTKVTSEAVKLENRFKAQFERPEAYEPKEVISGFAYPNLPVITHEHRHLIELYHWGLLPAWAKDLDIRKHTLNARIETLWEKPSFRSSVKNRCLVLVDGFYEWQWLDAAGKKKQRYLIQVPTAEPFAMAGLFQAHVNKETGEATNTFTIITTEANALMAEIHNTKKRMPMVLSAEEEGLWLSGEEISPIRDIELTATPL